MKMRLAVAFFFGVIALGLSFYYMGTDVFRGTAIVIGGLLIVILLLYIRRMINRNKLSMFLDEFRAKKRDMLVVATVTKVENMIWKYSQVEDASLECECVDQKGGVHVFKVTGVIGKFNVNKGDTVQVMVQSNKWSNYQIVLNGIVD